MREGRKFLCGLSVLEETEQHIFFFRLCVDVVEIIRRQVFEVGVKQGHDVAVTILVHNVLAGLGRIRREYREQLIRRQNITCAEVQCVFALCEVAHGHVAAIL